MCPELGLNSARSIAKIRLQPSFSCFEATECVIDQHHFDAILSQCSGSVLQTDHVSAGLLSCYILLSSAQIPTPSIFDSMEVGASHAAAALAALTAAGRSALQRALQTLRQRALKRDFVGSLKQLSRTESGDSGLMCPAWVHIQK